MAGGPAGSPAHLAQGARGDDVVHELHGQPAAQLDGVHVALAGPREGGEEEAHGQGIVQVAQRIDERGVPARPGGGAHEAAAPGLPRGLPPRCPRPSAPPEAPFPAPGPARPPPSPRRGAGPRPGGWQHRLPRGLGRNCGTRRSPLSSEGQEGRPSLRTQPERKARGGLAPDNGRGTRLPGAEARASGSPWTFPSPLTLHLTEHPHHRALPRNTTRHSFLSQEGVLQNGSTITRPPGAPVNPDTAFCSCTFLSFLPQDSRVTLASSPSARSPSEQQLFLGRPACGRRAGVRTPSVELPGWGCCSAGCPN